MNKRINTTVGIYDTCYRLIKHRDGTISVIVPYIKWQGSTGALDFKKVVISNDPIASNWVMWFFENNMLSQDNGLSLSELIYDYSFKGASN